MLTLDLNTDVEQELKNIAKQSGKETEQLIKELVLEYLEDMSDNVLLEKAMEKLAKGESSTISLQEWTEKLNNVDS